MDRAFEEYFEEGDQFAWLRKYALWAETTQGTVPTADPTPPMHPAMSLPTPNEPGGWAYTPRTEEELLAPFSEAEIKRLMFVKHLVAIGVMTS